MKFDNYQNLMFRKEQEQKNSSVRVDPRDDSKDEYVLDRKQAENNDKMTPYDQNYKGKGASVEII
jgi:hypothetical protein